MINKNKCEMIMQDSPYVIEETYRPILKDIPKQSHRREVVPRSNKRNNFKKKKK